MCRHLTLAIWICSITIPAHAGKIIIAGPSLEEANKAAERPSEQHQTYRERVLDEARFRAGRGETVIFDEPQSTAASQARRAREYLDEMSDPPEQIIILQNDQPASDAAKAREDARAWSSYSPKNAPKPTTRSYRCQTQNSAAQNTVGSIEGNVRGHTVIQANTSSVLICK